MTILSISTSILDTLARLIPPGWVVPLFFLLIMFILWAAGRAAIAQFYNERERQEEAEPSSRSRR